MFQYPEGWKAFRYIEQIAIAFYYQKCFNTPKGGRPSDTNELEINENKTLNVSIPRRVEGLPIPKNSPGNSPGEACFNTPKGGRPSDT